MVNGWNARSKPLNVVEVVSLDGQLFLTSTLILNMTEIQKCRSFIRIMLLAFIVGSLIIYNSSVAWWKIMISYTILNLDNS